MSVCTYDNPASMRRECWQDGKIIYSIDSKLFFLRAWPVPPEKFFFGANIGDWKEGQLRGDVGAMSAHAEKGIQ